MERGRGGSGRGGRGKTTHHPSDLYVLGPKGGRTEPNEPKRPVPVLSKPGPSSSLVDRRRIAPISTASGVPPAKKPKLVTGLSRPDPFATTPPPAIEKPWEQATIDVESVDLVPTVIEAIERNETDKVSAILCGSFKHLKMVKLKQDAALATGLLYLAKQHAAAFAREPTLDALCSIVRKEGPVTYKSRTACANGVLVLNVLFAAFQDMKRWPDTFMKLYIEDSLNDRVWVDAEQCRCFVDNIVASVHTVLSPRMNCDPDSIVSDLINRDRHREYLVVPRFRGNEENIENMVVEAIKDQLNRRQGLEGINKYFLKFLFSMCGITEVRAIIAAKLEVWLTNPKLMKTAQELLMYVCINCKTNSQRDMDVIAFIVKIRLKTKALSAFYTSCIKELLPANSNNLSTVLKQIVTNELSAARNPNNMPMLTTLFQTEPEKSATILANIFLEYLNKTEDHLRALRCLQREIARVLRADFDLRAFVRGLTGAREASGEFRERTFNAIVDLCTLCVFLVVVPHARTERKDVYMIEKMQQLISEIQGDVVIWFYENAFRVYKPSTNDFIHALHKMVFMEPADQYYKVDNWPPEQDRGLFIRYASEVPLQERTVLTILSIGLSKEHPLTSADALELVEQLVKRTSALKFSLTIPALTAELPTLVDLLFNLSTYHHPENIELPVGYVPPDLAIANLYWKSWIVLLIYCAHVPAVFGRLAWTKYPTLKVFIEMCITNHFVYPQTSDELQMQMIEKQKILEFETHLAAASTKMNVTESSSLLLSQLISMDPIGPPRRPPSFILDQLQQLNNSHKLGHLLCRSRAPDFLLDIIRKQGSSQSMPWLAELVQNSEGSFNHLPVQSLCEFLLSSNEKQQGKYQQLLGHLQGLLTDPRKSPMVVCEILDHFLRRLSSHVNKEQAISGLKLLLSTIDSKHVEEDESFGKQSFYILNKLTKIPHFLASRLQIVRALREACQVENDPDLITSYLRFLSRYAVSSRADLGEMTELVLDMAQLIVERSTVMTAVLPGPHETDESASVAWRSLIHMFYTYLNKAREPKKEAYLWSESQEQILVTWSSGEEATLYILVVHAIILLLTHGPNCGAKDDDQYLRLLEIWFPPKDQMPKAYLVDTSEEALLFPDWLKLRMIRSNVPRLVEEALNDLEPAQLLLFIQSFGIPVLSMSKLLETLDEMLLTDKANLSELGIDKAYMTQLVDVQHRRGATGGNIFAEAIKAIGPESPEPEVTDMIVDVKIPEISVAPSTTPVSRISLEEIDQIIDNVHVDIKLDPEKQRITQTRQKLLQTLSSEIVNGSKSSSYPTPVLKRVMQRLQRRCATDAEFVNGVLRNHHYMCRLLRLVVAGGRETAATRAIAKYVVRSVKGRHPLAEICRPFSSEDDSQPDAIADAEVTIDDLPECTIDKLEEVGWGVLKSEGMKVDGNKRIVESVAGLITRSDQKYNNSTGLLIDWLLQIEPEIIGSSDELQLEMLFSRDSNSKWHSLQNCRPYLLTLLTHHASWFTLEKAVTSLLTLEATEKYDASAVLEFLWALSRNPRLWQGREKSTPKHQEPEDILCLTKIQLICVIQYIVLEVESTGCDDKSIRKMGQRISHLVECAIKPDHTETLISIIVHLNEQSNISDERKSICQHLISHLYLRVPCIITLLNEMNISSDFYDIRTDAASVLDTISHSVLTSFTTNVQQKEWSKRGHDLEIVIRKMASTHPRLLLRQIRIIEASLMGRLHLEKQVFWNRNHIWLFVQIFGILELLQPYLFAREFSKSLNSIFDCYLNLFKNYSGAKEVTTLANRFVSLLQNYISYDSKSAMTYLQSQDTLLRELEVEYSDFETLCIRVTGVGGSAEEDKEIVIATSSQTPSRTPKWDEIINSFKWKDMVYVLTKLEAYPLHQRLTLLEPLLESIVMHVEGTTWQTNRQIAHKLLAQCARHEPRSVTRVLPALVRCLHSADPSVVREACDRLPELIVCAQENAVSLLHQLFVLGIKRNINTSICITKTISLLRVQMSC